MNRTLSLVMFILCALFGVYIFFDTMALVGTLPQETLMHRFVAIFFVWSIGLCFGGLSSITSARSPAMCRCG